MEKLLAERCGALTESGTLKNGFLLLPNWIGKDDREVLQLLKIVVAETRYNGVFNSRGRQVVVGQTFV
jgi:hypothetical protein